MHSLIHTLVTLIEAAALLWLLTPVIVVVLMLIYNLFRLIDTLNRRFITRPARLVPIETDWSRPAGAVQGR